MEDLEGVVLNNGEVVHALVSFKRPSDGAILKATLCGQQTSRGKNRYKVVEEFVTCERCLERLQKMQATKIAG